MGDSRGAHFWNWRDSSSISMRGPATTVENKYTRGFDSDPWHAAWMNGQCIITGNIPLVF